MTQEVYVDGIGNISVQGPVVTLTLVRNQQGSEANQNAKSDVLHAGFDLPISVSAYF